VAWWDRIPAEGWALMGLIAILYNALLGFGAARNEERGLFLILPLAECRSSTAEIVSRRSGAHNVAPSNAPNLMEGHAMSRRGAWLSVGGSGRSATFVR
jgi:hypothetical protein